MVNIIIELIYYELGYNIILISNFGFFMVIY